MIDNLSAAMALLDRLHASLPLSARLTPEAAASLSARQAAKLASPACTIIGLHCAGDTGGILCGLDLGPAYQDAAFVSMKHLRFDARLPLARAITTYQKHRVKRLLRQPC